MTRKNMTTMRAMMMAIMTMMCLTISAQRGGGRGGHGSEMGGRTSTEMRGGRGSGSENRGGYNLDMRGGRGSEMGGRGYTEMRGGRHDQMRGMSHRGGHDFGRRPHHEMHHPIHHRPVVHHMPHHIPARWAHCVRYMPDGRWGYCRDGYWYYYDCYYEPEFYFAHPVAHFHSNCLGTVAAAAVTTAAVAGLISTLMR